MFEGHHVEMCINVELYRNVELRMSMHVQKGIGPGSVIDVTALTCVMVVALGDVVGKRKMAMQPMVQTLEHVCIQPEGYKYMSCDISGLGLHATCQTLPEAVKACW